MAQLALAAWVVLEVAVRVWEVVRGKGGRAHDRGTRVLVALSLAAAIGVAFATRSERTWGTWGAVVMWLGLALRVWAIAALGVRFRTTVEVDADQTVITTGPYRWIRHPSYAGLLLIVAGLGLALGTWLSFVACLVVPLPAIVWRIRVEEAELNRVLGDAYATYQAGTKRLIPRVW